MLYLPCDHSVAHHSDAVWVLNHDRAVEESGIAPPCRTGHLAISVQREPGSKHRIIGSSSAGMNGRNAGADRPVANYQLSFARNQSGVPDLDALDVGNRIAGAGCAIERYA